MGVATQKIDDDDGFELAAPSVTARRSGERRQSAESKRSRRIKPGIALILSVPLPQNVRRVVDQSNQGVLDGDGSHALSL